MKKRYEYPLYAFYDHTGMARHLEKMSEKGWMLERIYTNSFWRYRRCEPKRRHFAVTYFPTASDFDAAPGADQQEFYDLCQAAGWQFVAQTFQMQVFCNEQEDTVPLDTDPGIQVKNIHEGMWSSYIWGKIIALGFAGFILLKALSSFANQPFSFLSQYLSLLLFGLGAVLLLHQGTELTAYYLWHHRAARTAEEEGRFLPTRGGIWREAFYGALYAALCLSYAVVGSWRITLSVGLFALAVEFCRRISYVLRDALKRRGTSRHLNRVVTFLFLFLLISGVQYVQRSNIDFVLGPGHATETYTYQGKTYTAYCDELPLSVETLLGTDDSHYSNRLLSQGNILASKLSGYQTLRNDHEKGEGQPARFYYHAYYSGLDVALDDAAQWRSYYNPYFYDTTAPKDSHAIDPAPWGAQAAWKNGMDYLFRFEDCVIQLSFGWYPTEAQLQTALDALLPL